MRHLLVMPYDRPEVAKFMWNILELFVHRVVVQKEDDDWENDRVRLDLDTFERLHQDEPPLSEEESLAMLKSVLEALEVLFPGLEIPKDGEGDDLEFKERTADEEKKVREKRTKEKAAKEKTKGKGAEARAALSVDEKLAHLMSDEDDFLPSAAGNDDDAAPITGGPSMGGPLPPGAPPPPPMPGMGKPLGPKLRRFNWVKIPVPKVPGTIFKDMDPDKCFLDIEKKYMEGAYYVKQAKKLGEKSKFNQVNIVDLKRAQTIGILLARIKQTPAVIAQAVLELDEQTLTLEDVRSLCKFSPTKDEVDSLKKYIDAGSDVDKLGLAELFFIELMAVRKRALVCV